MAKLSSSATPAVLAGLAVVSTVLVTFILRKAWGSGRGSRERQIEPVTSRRLAPSSGQEPVVNSRSDCTERFEEACAAVESAVSEMPNVLRLEFYGLFKQATQGDCEQEEPSYLKPTVHAKWTAWQARKGLPPDAARAAYVELAQELGILHPATVVPSASRSGFGPVHSRPVMPDHQDGPKTSKGDELCCLAAEGNLELIKQALSDASVVNVTGEGRMTALHFAADRGHADVVRLLITCGADVNHTDDCGETALHVAIAADQAEIVGLLVAAGADMSIKNNEGFSCSELLAQSEACGR